MTENHFDRISRHFRSIRNFFFSQNGCRWPFWMTENHFQSHFSSFQINTQLFYFCSQNGCQRPFWITKNHFFDRISHHFRSIRNFYFFTKWLPVAILDDRKSLSIAFLAISDQYVTLIFFHKMAAGGHFGLPKITFDRISRHFRSIRNFFFTKWLPVAILDDRKSLSIAFLVISDQYATFFIFVHKMAAGGHFG